MRALILPHVEKAAERKLEYGITEWAPTALRQLTGSRALQVRFPGNAGSCEKIHRECSSATAAGAHECKMISIVVTAALLPTGETRARLTFVQQFTIAQKCTS